MMTILVTGATDGIGRETARQLLLLGHRVLVHGRNEARAAAVVRELPPGGEPVWGDLAEMRQVVALAARVQALAPSLDVLVNNAGVFETTRRLTADGFERTMAVNHFATMLLTLRVLPQLEAAPQGRVVTVASVAHHRGHLDLDDLTLARSFSPYGAYAASKLANVLFSAELARRLAGTAVTANALHPGVITTKLLRAGFDMTGASVADGARTPVYLATAEDVAATTGGYFDNARQATASRPAGDESLASALWARSEALLGPWLTGG